jgi:uncharacterized membrane protein YhaH (DUF805 family)
VCPVSCKRRTVIVNVPIKIMISMIFIIFIGTFTMTVRRLHDTGHTMVLPLIILIFTSIRKISSIVDRT